MKRILIIGGSILLLIGCGKDDNLSIPAVAYRPDGTYRGIEHLTGAYAYGSSSGTIHGTIDSSYPREFVVTTTADSIRFKDVHGRSYVFLKDTSNYYAIGFDPFRYIQSFRLRPIGDSLIVYTNYSGAYYNYSTTEFRAKRQ